MQSWNKLTARGLQFAVRLSPDVYAVQVKSETAKMREMTGDWERLVAEPVRAAGLPMPQLMVLPSRYRQLFKPLIDFVIDLRDENPGRDIVVVIPNLVVAHWYQGFLHNNRGAILRTLLRLRGGPNVIVLNPLPPQRLARGLDRRPGGPPGAGARPAPRRRTPRRRGRLAPGGAAGARRAPAPGWCSASSGDDVLPRYLGADPAVDILARLGALVLLFDAGLALNVRDVLRVGGAAARVALLGTVASFALGLGGVALVLPDAPAPTRAFLAGALTATSVGISARVLKDIGRTRTIEARTVLGAAVIDDVIGLLVLSLVSGWATAQGSAGLRAGGLVLLLGKTALFFGVALSLGPRLVPRLLHASARLQTHRALVVVGLAFCLLLAWAADALGLAPIVGAFTAGLVLEEAHWREFLDRGERGLDQEIEPLNAFLVPLFFALLGLRTDLLVFADPSALALAVGLTAAAILGKLACGLGAARGSSRLAVSFGMMPRGEVSLVFASLGVSRRGRPPGARPPCLLGAGDDGGADDAGHAAGTEVELRAGEGDAAEQRVIRFTGTHGFVGKTSADMGNRARTTMISRIMTRTWGGTAVTRGGTAAPDGVTAVTWAVTTVHEGRNGRDLGRNGRARWNQGRDLGSDGRARGEERPCSMESGP